MWQEAWAEVEAATRDRRHAFRQFTLGTSEPDLRTMTLRACGPWWVQCHSDARSPKISALERGVGVLFYDRPAGLQIRGNGRAVVHQGDSVAAEAWSQTKPWARRCYLGPLGSSTPVEEPSAGFPEEFAEREPTLEESERGFAAFAVIRVHLDALDIVRLAHDGHRRLAVDLRTIPPQIQWLIP